MAQSGGLWHERDTRRDWLGRRTDNNSFTTREALFYHETIRPGKIEIVASKPMATQRDLSLAYSPGVAVPVEAIADDPALRCTTTPRKAISWR